VEKTKYQINVVLDETMITRLAEMSQLVGVERCQLVRMLITQAYDKIKDGTFTVGPASS